MSTVYFRTRLIRFKAESSTPSLQYLEDAIVSVSEGKILSVTNAEQALAEGLSLESIQGKSIQDKRPQLMIAGFIDSHVHSPQMNMIGSYGRQLMDWLEHYTFPSEIQYKDPEYSKSESARFIDALLANGTTSACIFTTTFAHNTEDIFEESLARKMRVIAGKVLMDRNAPSELLDTQHWQSETKRLIDRYHHKGRLAYAVTPRFSITSTPEQLQAAGELLNYCDDLWIQTHLSENQSEINTVKKLFSEAQHYLDTYEAYGLHTERSIFAHCIHLEAAEIERIKEVGSSIAFCPSSNFFLGSGLLDLSLINENNIPYSLATDVGAGTSLSMFQVMGDAYKVAQLKGYSLSASEAYYAATLGAAKALKLSERIGNISVGNEADFIFINAENHPVIKQRLLHAKTIEEELFVYMIMGDERLIDQTYVYGELVYENPFSNRGEAA